MKRIDVYDFDHTVFNGETSLAFYRYAFFKRPLTALFSPVSAIGGLLLLLRPDDLTIGKRLFLLPLKLAGAFDLLPAFWEEMKRKGRIAPWFKPTENDLPIVICSATPDFMLKPLLTGKYAVSLILGTPVDPDTLLFLGPNNRGVEKVRRLNEAVPGAVIRVTASDSLKHDKPILDMAEQPILVRKFHRTPLNGGPSHE